MTVIATLLGIGLIIWGILLFVSDSKKSKAQSLEVVEKDGLPITPRNQRVRPTIVNDDDALSNLAAAASTQTHHAGGDARFGFGQTPKTDFVKTEESDKSEIDVAVTVGDKADHNTVPDTTTTVNIVSEVPTVTVSQKEVVFESESLEMAESVAVYDEKMAQKDKLATFDGHASVLDQHFHEQEMEKGRNQQEIVNSRDPIVLIINPKDGLGVSGSTILRLAQDYAMKYGALNMFHRHENAEGTGQLWFSMMGMNSAGVVEFDLVALPMQNFKGLALFISLPHPQALQGFDSMVSVATAIADEIDAEILNEGGEVMGSTQFQSLRNVVASYA